MKVHNRVLNEAKVGLKGNEAKGMTDYKASRIVHKEKLYKMGGKMVPLKTLLENRKK